MNKLVKILLATTFVIAWTGSVQAAVEWKFGSNGGSYVSDPNDYNFNKTVDGINLKITAWANTIADNQSGSASSPFARSNLVQWGGGLGIETGNGTGSPEHAIGDYDFEEFLLLEFSENVAITQIGNGYAREWPSKGPDHTTVDASILAFDNSGGATPLPMTSYSSTGTSGLQNNDWTHIDTYFANGGKSGNFNPAPVNLGDDDQVFSNVWLIGNANEHITPYGGAEDFFKLNLVKVERRTGCPPGTPGCEPGVPAPATAALLGLGLLLLRRRVSQ